MPERQGAHARTGQEEKTCRVSPHAALLAHRATTHSPRYAGRGDAAQIKNRSESARAHCMSPM